MLTFKDFQRLIRPLQNKIYLIIGRSLLRAVNNGGRIQRVQIEGLYNEIITDMERFQDYGFASRPLCKSNESTDPEEDPEALAVFINGNREQGIVISVMPRMLRPRDLEEGDVALYTEQDSLLVDNNEYPDKVGHDSARGRDTAGHRIWLRRDQVIQVDCKQLHLNGSIEVKIATPLVDIDTETMDVVATTNAIFSTPDFEVKDGTVKLGSHASVEVLCKNAFKTLYNNHTHGGGAIPDQQADSSHMTSNTEAS